MDEKYIKNSLQECKEYLEKASKALEEKSYFEAAMALQYTHNIAVNAAISLAYMSAYKDMEGICKQTYKQ